MKVELEFISDITILSRNKQRTITKNDKVKKLFDLDAVDLQEYIDPKTGKHISKYSTLTELKPSGEVFYKINKPYEELKSLILNRTIPVLGLMSKSKKHK